MAWRHPAKMQAALYWARRKRKARLSGPALSGAALLIDDETQGIAIDFTDLSMIIRDTGTPANAFDGLVTGKLTYTSPSTKRIRNAAGLLEAGTTLRTEYGPSGAIGVRIEAAQATNLILNSEDISAASWALTNILAFGSGSTVNAITSPDGTTTADFICPSTASGTHYVQQGSLGSASSTFSCFVKAGGYSKLMMFFAGSPNSGATFDLVAGTADNTANGLAPSSTRAGIEPWANGWYRIWCNSSASTSTVRIYVLQDFSSATYAADGTSGVYLWGAQFETGTGPSSYIPTTSATVTRAADNITQALSTISWAASTPMSAYFDFVRCDASSTARIWQIGGVAPSGETRGCYMPNSSGINFYEYDGFSTQANPPVTVSAAGYGVRYKAASRHKVNDVRGASGGVLSTHDTSATLCTPTTAIRIGDGDLAVQHLIFGSSNSYLFHERCLTQSFNRGRQHDPIRSMGSL